VIEVSKMLCKRTEIAQTALPVYMWAQDKEGIRDLSESYLQGLAKSTPKACQQLDKNS
jgi:hypothetical protein